MGRSTLCSRSHLATNMHQDKSSWHIRTGLENCTWHICKPRMLDQMPAAATTCIRNLSAPGPNQDELLNKTELTQTAAATRLQAQTVVKKRQADVQAMLRPTAAPAPRWPAPASPHDACLSGCIASTSTVLQVCKVAGTHAHAHRALQLAQSRDCCATCLVGGTGATASNDDAVVHKKLECTSSHQLHGGTSPMHHHSWHIAPTPMLGFDYLVCNFKSPDPLLASDPSI